MPHTQNTHNTRTRGLDKRCAHGRCTVFVFTTRHTVATVSTRRTRIETNLSNTYYHTGQRAWNVYIYSRISIGQFIYLSKSHFDLSTARCTLHRTHNTNERHLFFSLSMCIRGNTSPLSRPPVGHTQRIARTASCRRGVEVGMAHMLWFVVEELMRNCEHCVGPIQFRDASKSKCRRPMTSTATTTTIENIYSIPM